MPQSAQEYTDSDRMLLVVVLTYVLKLAILMDTLMVMLALCTVQWVSTHKMMRIGDA